MSPQHFQSQSETQIYHLQQYRQTYQRPRKHLCRKLHKYHTIAFALALVNLHTVALVSAYIGGSDAALAKSHRDDPFSAFYTPAATNVSIDAHNSTYVSNNLIRQRRSPNPAPDSVSSLYSALPAARTGNSAIYFSRSSSSAVTHENAKQYRDNRKPAFKKCASYKPSVREEEPENTLL
ncbi:unnamed protein product [Ceratitis capitata]|uniref:(Mediterranean fruit fly) hypothetical protein n=1 Tax=Ceratitis capitata TaxID=7213 RepID=A0A811VFG0_CERCA|nr:unnamed protein product [Ceratitis capitata]